MEEYAIYGSTKKDKNLPLKEDNVRRVYLDSFDDEETANQNCRQLNEGNRVKILKFRAQELLRKITDKEWDRF